MEPLVWAALVTAVATVLVTAGGWIVERRKRLADVAKATAEASAVKATSDSTVMEAVNRAAAMIQDRYQELIADITAQANAMSARLARAEIAARDAQASAAEAEAQAWRAQQQARAMARFLHELRPVIAAHVPEAEAAQLLMQMDKLTSLL